MIVAILAILFQDVAPQSEILDRAIKKLSESTAHLRKYTCLETVDRAYYTDRSRKPGKSMMIEAPPDSCSGAGFDHQDRLHLDSEDRLRLQVAVSGGEEIDSWANASRFDSRSIFELIPDGPRSTGAFGTSLVNIFRNTGTQYTYLGRKIEGSRPVFEYSFTVSLETSHYFIDVRKQWRKIAYHGSFELDATTADLVRLTSETPELTPETQMCLARTVTEYRLAPVGEGQYLIPSRSELDVVSPGARETHSLSTFAACHEYAAESSVTFDSEIPAAAATAAPKTVPPLPAGVSLTLALAAPIDLSIAAAGDAVTARVVKAVRAHGSNEILVAVGAIVHGRILDMRRQYDTSQFQYAIHYDSLEQNGVVQPLSIRLDREVLIAQQRTLNRFAVRGTEFSLPPPTRTSESGSWFFLPTAVKPHVVAAGNESRWVTVAK